MYNRQADGVTAYTEEANGETETGLSEENFRSNDLHEPDCRKWVSQAIAVAADLGIADALKDGPRTAADIARTANASEGGVYRLLRALGSVGLFTETGNRRFRLTPLGVLPRKDSTDSPGETFWPIFGFPGRWTRRVAPAGPRVPDS